MKLTIPNNPGFSGVSYGISFKNGVSAEVDNEKLVKRLIKRGYALVEEPVTEPVTEPVEAVEAPAPEVVEAEPAEEPKKTTKAKK